MSNPLDDYLSDRGTIKKATQLSLPMGGMGSRLGGFARKAGRAIGEEATKGIGSALGAGAVGGVSAALGVAGMKIYRAVQKRGDFKTMLAQNPDLHEHHEQDPSGFNARYTSLRAMVPAYAQDPIIAGSLMRNMSLNPETAGTVLMQAMESRSKTGPNVSMSMGPAQVQARF
jgi:hypothetical protein